ncbi:MAG: methyl-accepting chemotaxis protein [Bacillota bacterium]
MFNVKKIKSIKFKMILMFVIFISLIIALLAFFTYNRSAGILHDNILIAAQENAENSSVRINNWIEDIIAKLEIMASSNIVKDDNWAVQKDYLSNFSGEDKYMTSIFIADRNGQANITHGSGANIRERDYFQEVIQTGEPAVSQVIISKATNEYIVVVAYPIYEGNRVTGVIGTTVDLHYLDRLINNIDILDHGYAWVIDSEMNMIAHPSEKYLGDKTAFDNGGPALKENAARMTRGEKNVNEYSFEGVKKVMAYAPVESADWSIAVSAEIDDIMAPLDVLLQGTFIYGLIAILIAGILTYIIASLISNPVVKITEIASSVAEGDLTVDSSDLDDIKRSDEIGHLALSIRNMHKSLINMIKKVLETSSNVAASSEELHAAGEQVGEVAEQVGEAIENVASGAEEQSAQVEESVAMIDEMVEKINSVGKDTKEMSNAADTVIDRIDKGNNTVVESIKRVKVVKEDTSEVAEVISELGQTSREIGNIVEIINSIATQTNLLALNAAIEAARAGEAGSGFSVVAEEIRVLAEDSGSATEKIANLINEIQEDVQIVTEKMKENIDSVDGSVISIEDMGNEFKEIENVTRRLKEIIENVSNNSLEMARNSDMVEKAIVNIASVSDEFAGNTEEVAASSEEQIAATEEIISSSKQLADMAEKLSVVINRFKL